MDNFTLTFNFKGIGNWNKFLLVNSSKHSDVLQLYKKNITWSDLNRWYDDSPPSYTLYTGLSLAQYFTGFWVILFIHVLCNIAIVAATSEHFRRNFTIFSAFIHALENTNIPTCWRDWDQDNGSVTEHKIRHKQVVKEMVSLMTFRTLVHGLLLSPIIYTGE